LFSNQYAFPLLHVGMTGVDDLSESLMAPPDVVDASSSAVAKKRKSTVFAIDAAGMIRYTIKDDKTVWAWRKADLANVPPWLLQKTVGPVLIPGPSLLKRITYY